MARGHEVRIAGDTRDFERSVKNGIVDPLDDAQRAFDKLGDASEDAGREASRSLDRFEDDLKDAQRQTEKLSRAQKDVGDVGDRSFRKVGGAGSEVMDELGQNIGETFSSFRGNLEDLPQIAQDTLGGLAGSGALGGIAGLAATAAGAAGLGLITAAIQGQIEDAEALKERLSDAYREAVEAGRSYIDEAQVISEWHDLAFNPDRADEWKQLQEDAKTLGLDAIDLAAANVGKAEEQREVQDRINALLEDQDSYYTTLKDGIELMEPGVKSLVDRWGQVIEETEAQKQKVKELEAGEAAYQEKNREQIRKTSQAAEARLEALKKQYDSPIKAKVVYEVDDSAVRVYRPPVKSAEVRYSPSGRPME